MNTTQLQSYYDQTPSARRMALASVGLVMMICSLALSAVNIAIPRIAEDLQASALAVSWIPVAMLWGNVVFLLPIGRIADIVGRKRVFVAGMLLFILSSLCVLLPQSIGTLLVIRVVQGISSSMVYGTSMAIIGVVYANSNRGQALGIAASSVYLGLTLGPLVGGWLTEHWGWKSVFWVPVPILLLCLVALLSYVKGDWKSELKAQVRLAREPHICCLGERFYAGAIAPNRLAICTASHFRIGFVGCFCMASIKNRQPPHPSVRATG